MMEDTGRTLISLLLISVMALAVPMALHRLKFVRIPVIVGEIICGIIAGRSFLNLIDPENALLNLLSLLGFTYLIFLGGMEIDFQAMSGAGRKASGRKAMLTGTPLSHGIVIFALTIGISYIAALYMDGRGLVRAPTNTMMLALLLGTTSVGVVLPILKESRETECAYGQTLLTSAMVADFATILMATVALLLLSPGKRGMELAALAMLALSFYTVYQAGMRLTSRPVVRRLYAELSHTSAQLRVRTAFALMLLFAAMSELIGVEIVLGAFLAGALYRMMFHREGLVAEMKFDAIGYGFFIPVFFIMVGVRLDVAAIWRTPGVLSLMAVMTAVAFGVKIVPALVLAPRFGIRNSLAGGFLLSGRLSLIIAFAEIAVAARLLQPEMGAVSILIAVVTCTVAPVAYMALKREASDYECVGVVIAGAGKVGRLLAARLQDRNHAVTLIDNRAAEADKARDAGLRVYHGDALSGETLERAGAGRANLFVAVTGDDDINLEACKTAKRHFGITNLVARVGNPARLPEFNEAGIRPMNTTAASVIALENIMYRPTVYSLLAHEQEGREVVEVTVSNEELAGRRLMDISLPGDALVLLVDKGQGAIVPHGSTRLDAGDTLTLFLNEGSIVDVTRLFDPGRPDLEVRIEEDMV